MKYPVCGIVVYLIGHALLLATSTSARQSKGSSGPLAAIGGHPRCTEKNPAPDCVPIPQVVSARPATYSDEARKAKIEGVSILVLWVDEKGNVTDARVVRGLGMGLDEKAIEAVRGWKFEPAFGKDGKPVAAKTAVEVSFHL